MKLVYPKDMTTREMSALKICLESQSVDVKKDDVLFSVLRDPRVLGEGLKVIDEAFPVPGAGTADLLAADASGDIFIINICDVFDVDALTMLLNQTEWLSKNGAILRHYHSDLNFTGSVKAIIIAGDVSSKLECLLKKLDMQFVDIYSYKCLKNHEEKWLILQKYVMAETRFSSENVVSKSKALEIRSILTEEEIDDFFEGEARLVAQEDEITSRFSL